jgi:hypothetical protein
MPEFEANAPIGVLDEDRELAIPGIVNFVRTNYVRNFFEHNGGQATSLESVQRFGRSTNPRCRSRDGYGQGTGGGDGHILGNSEARRGGRSQETAALGG